MTRSTRRIIEELRARFPDFAPRLRAGRPGASRTSTPSAPTVRTLRAFIASYHDLLHAVTRRRPARTRTFERRNAAGCPNRSSIQRRSRTSCRAPHCGSDQGRTAPPSPSRPRAPAGATCRSGSPGSPRARRSTRVSMDRRRSSSRSQAVALASSTDLTTGRSTSLAGSRRSMPCPGPCMHRPAHRPGSSGGPTARATDDRVVVAIAEAPSSGFRDVADAPFLIGPDDVDIEIRGAGNATRQINKIIGPDSPADRLEVVEVLTPSGNWSSWPPHKHDRDEMPDEAVLEEVYYYRFRRPRGVGSPARLSGGSVARLPDGSPPWGLRHRHRRLPPLRRRPWRRRVLPERVGRGSANDGLLVRP